MNRRCFLPLVGSRRSTAAQCTLSDFGDLGANPNVITKEKYQALVDAHVMFKDMDADLYLKSAGIVSQATGLMVVDVGNLKSKEENYLVWRRGSATHHVNEEGLNS